MLPKRLKYYQCYISFADYIANGRSTAQTLINQATYSSSTPSTAAQVGLALFSGALDIAATAAVTSSSNNATKNAALADATTRITTCDAQITSLCSQIQSDYGITVNQTTGEPDTTFENQKKSIEEQIKTLKSSYEDTTAGQEDAVRSTGDANADRIQKYNEAKTNYNNLNTAVQTCTSYDNQLTNFNTGTSSYLNKPLITISGGKATAQTFDESEYSTVFKVKDKVASKDTTSGTYAGSAGNYYDKSQAMAAAQKDNEAAQARAKEYNDIANAKAQLLQNNNCNDLQGLTSARDKVKTEMDEAANAGLTETRRSVISEGSGSSGVTITAPKNKMTVAQYTAKLNSLEAQQTKLNSGEKDFNNSLAQIKSYISQRNTAQNLLDEYNDIGTAKTANKNASGKAAKTVAKRNVKTQKAEFANALEMYYQMFTKQS